MPFCWWLKGGGACEGVDEGFQKCLVSLSDVALMIRLYLHISCIYMLTAKKTATAEQGRTIFNWCPHNAALMTCKECNHRFKQVCVCHFWGDGSEDGEVGRRKWVNMKGSPQPGKAQAFNAACSSNRASDLERPSKPGMPHWTWKATSFLCPQFVLSSLISFMHNTRPLLPKPYCPKLYLHYI